MADLVRKTVNAVNWEVRLADYLHYLLKQWPRIPFVCGIGLGNQRNRNKTSQPLEPRTLFLICACTPRPTKQRPTILPAVGGCFGEPRLLGLNDSSGEHACIPCKPLLKMLPNRTDELRPKFSLG